MKCAACDIEMKKVDMVECSPGGPVSLRYQRDFWSSAKQSAVECLVCPGCGHIELRAEEPEVYKDI